MKCSLIIPVLNERAALQQLIPNLIANNLAHELEFIICDGGSSDLSAAYIRGLQRQYADNALFSFQYLPTELGRATQMNAGAAIARFPLLLFLHADTQLPFNWLEQIAEKQWGCFQVRLSGQQFMFRVIERFMNWRSCLTQVATGDQAIFVQQALFVKVNGFTEQPLMEDVALSKKLRKQHKMSCVKTPLITSSRRWENKGIIKTVLLMWALRLAYVLGVPAAALAKIYYPKLSIKKSDELLQVFAKQVLEGYVKTRLSPDLTPQQAKGIYAFLLNRILTQVVNYGGLSEVWVAYQQQIKHDLPEFLGLVTHTQTGVDLGARMANALQQGLIKSKKVVLIGTDSIDLTQQHIHQLIKALDTVEIAFVPVLDGGFIAMACRVFDAQIFAHVRWGTATALADVVNNINTLSLSYQCLEPVRDIDTYQDVLEYPELETLTR